MAALFITLWLLSGFLAAWLMHKYWENDGVDWTILPVVIFSVLGGFSICLMLGVLFGESIPRVKEYFSNTVVFKAKEKK